jgi:biopolymer transport protein ExbB
MKDMLKVLLTLLLFVSVLSAQDRRREALKEEDELFKTREQLIMLRNEFDRIRVQRWQDKRNEVAKKEAFQELWDEMRREMDKLQAAHTQKEETLMRLNSQASEAEKEIEETNTRLKSFGIQISDKLVEFQRQLKSSFPVDLPKHLAKAEEFQQTIENRQHRPTPDILSGIFQQQLDVFKNNEVRSISRTRLPMKGVASATAGMKEKMTTQMMAGWKINIGGIYQSFISTESDDAAILAKTGRLDEDAWMWLEELVPDKRANLLKVGTQISAQAKNLPMLIPVDIQLRKAVGEGYSSTRQTNFLKDLKEELIGAGFVIYGIGFLVFASLLILAEKIYMFSVRGRNSNKYAREVIRLVEAGDFPAALESSKSAKGSVPSVFVAVLEAARNGKSREEAENCAYEAILHETPAIEKNISTINIFAAAAPLFGLLGTVSGMVSLFAAITLHGTSDPKIMADGIAEALLSTKWGLIAAIPLLLVYNWASNGAGQMISNMEKYSTRLINRIYGEVPEDELFDLTELQAPDSLVLPSSGILPENV